MSEAYQVIGGIRVYKFIGKKYEGHPNYTEFKYCIADDLEFPKQANKCNICHHTLRTQPRAGIRLRKFKDKK